MLCPFFVTYLCLFPDIFFPALRILLPELIQIEEEKNMYDDSDMKEYKIKKKSSEKG